MKKESIEQIISQFMEASNAFDVKAALALFASNAIIDDVSVGETFKNTAGVRNYLEKFFVGYHTVTRLESLEVSDSLRAKAQVDFTGDFGHETGALDFTLNADGLIIKIDAWLD
jgi:ketosteroid isomerase-like protein